MAENGPSTCLAIQTILVRIQPPTKCILRFKLQQTLLIKVIELDQSICKGHIIGLGSSVWHLIQNTMSQIVPTFVDKNYYKLLITITATIKWNQSVQNSQNNLPHLKETNKQSEKISAAEFLKIFFQNFSRGR